MELGPPRGTTDLFPPRSEALLELAEEAHRVARLFGYRYVDTPAFEHTELFARSSGQSSDVVTKEMYTFEDKGGRSVTLRPESTAPVVRAALERVAQATGWPALHAELAARDPVAASRIQPADAQRIQRALEVLQLTGERLSDLQRQAEPPAVRLARFALMPVSRPELYVRINERFDQMVAAGLVDEVRALQARGDLDPDLPSLRAVGYRQIWQYLAGECSLEEAVAAARQATRNLAKRQLTWLRGDPAVTWLPSLAERDLVPIYEAVSSAAGKIGAKTLC